MKFRKSALALAAVSTLTIAQLAQAVDISPRAGISAGFYNTGTTDGVGGGFNAGTTFTFDRVFVDVNLEAVQFSVRDPNASASNSTAQTDGWRSEASVAAGLPVWNTFSLFGGVRQVRYGTSLGASNSATMSGPFIGMALSSLTMPGDDKNLFSISFAVQPTTYTPNNRSAEKDVGLSVKLGYRRAGSPHAWAIRYQSFGGEISYSEYSATLQYAYNF